MKPIKANTAAPIGRARLPKLALRKEPTKSPMREPKIAVIHGGIGFIRPGRNSRADIIGENVRALNVDIAIENMIVTAN